MDDSTTPQDSAAMSPASTGSRVKKPAAYRVYVEGIGSIMPICQDWVEVQGICNRFGNRVYWVAPLYEETQLLPAVWIPVSERLPKRYARVLVWVRCDSHEHPHGIGFIGSTGLWSLDELHEPWAEITHWMPLPAPPTHAK